MAAAQWHLQRLQPVWGQEIHNAREGHFLELSARAFAKSIRESMSRVRVLYSHGQDSAIGTQLLGKLTAMREDADGAHYQVELFAGVPALLLEGLRSGSYGSSFRAKVIKEDFTARPGRSTFNPQGLPQSVVSELKFIDIGPTSLPPAYPATTAQMRSRPEARARLAELGEEEPPSWFLEPANRSWFVDRKVLHVRTR